VILMIANLIQMQELQYLVLFNFFICQIIISCSLVNCFD